MIKGTGIDIVEIERIEKALQRHGDKFLQRLLTMREQESWQQRGARTESLAGYWAAKEAVAKALGTGFVNFGLADISIVYDQHGRPTVVLAAGAADLAAKLGMTNFWLSISHSRHYAVATAIGEGAY